MADLIIPAGALPPNTANIRYKDMGDGTYALVTSGASGGDAVVVNGLINTTTLLDAVTTVSAGASVPGVAGFKTFQARGNTQSGTGDVSVKVQGSIDGTYWDDIAVITLSLTTVLTGDSFTSNDRFAFLRGNVDSISGTGTVITLSMSA